MATAELGACEWFVNELRRSGLVEKDEFEGVVEGFLRLSPRGEPKELADVLVEKGLLSPFQAERAVAGKATGLVLGPYVLIDAIGSGSFGKGYKAKSKTDGKYYAVKVLPRRSIWHVRLARRQVRAFSQFEHPSVVPFIDVGTAGGLHYLIWPFVEGESLEKRVQREGQLPPGVAALFILQIAHGLSVAYQNGLFHGLLKPSSVAISPNQTAQVLDFGIGSLLVENQDESMVDTMASASALTSGLSCCSPECILNPTERTPAGDQYSLGCMLYYCLTGHYPFENGSAVETIMAHQSKEPPPIRQLNANVPDGLAAIVSRLMKKKPDDRFAQIEELVDALEQFAIEPSQAAQDGSAMMMETPRPDMTSVVSKPKSSPALSNAVNKQMATPATNANLPGGVRLDRKPDVKPAEILSNLADDHADNEPEIRFGPLTLVLTGMALVCLFYLSLSYFRILH